MIRKIYLKLFTLTLLLVVSNLHAAGDLESQFRQLPMEARRLTGPLFWMHGDDNETAERLEEYLEIVTEAGNGCFTAESRPHSDWLGDGWYKDLDICLQKAKKLDLKMWIFDERWWPSQSIGGKVPPRYAAKRLVADTVDSAGPKLYKADGFSGDRYIGAVAGKLNDRKEILSDSLIDLAAYIENGKLNWDVPKGNWQVIKFTHKQARGLGGGANDWLGGKDLSIDGASRDCTDWFIETVYQPHYDHFKEDFGETIVGYFYDEPETKGDWGTELNVVFKEWGVDWKKAYVAYKLKLAGDDQLAARYQYMEAIAEAWGRVMYGGMSKWCHDHGVTSIGHFMEHNNLYVHPTFCAGDMMRLQKYSDMGAIDLVIRQMYPGQRPQTIYQTPKLGSSISHVYGKKDDIAMCEIFGGYNQKLTYPEMKWLTDQNQVRGINFMIPHSFNPKAPYDRDYPPYFYNDGHEPRFPLYRVWADYTTRLSLMLTGGKHVCPVAILFSGNAKRVGKYVTPEDMTTVLQDALYDCDWLPFEAFDSDASIKGKNVKLHQESYQVLIVPPTEVIPYAVLAKVKKFFDAGGVVVGYGHLPSLSGTVGCASDDIVKLRDEIWGAGAKISSKACKTSNAGGRSYFLPEKPDVAAINATLADDASILPVIEVLEGETNNWLHVLHRVKDNKDIFFICNQDHVNKAKTFRLKITADGFPEIWDAMRNEINSIPFKRNGKSVELSLVLEPSESALLVFNKQQRDLPGRITDAEIIAGKSISVIAQQVHVSEPKKLKSAKHLTVSPVKADPFIGRCNLPESVDIKNACIVIDMDGLSPEQAARITVNGDYAGGFIERPLRLDITKYLKHGKNTVKIEPFTPKLVRLVILNNKNEKNEK
jgi:hypothetical protein